MNDKTGKQFEGLVGEIYDILSSDDRNTEASVDVKLPSPDGPRQFDVVIRSQVAGVEIITVVEARDRNKNLAVTHVDGLHSKMIGVNANKGILVARKGFSGGALKKAKRLGIDLCTAHDLSNIKDFVPKAPVVVHNLTFDFTSIGCRYLRQKNTTIDFMHFKIGEKPVLDIFREEIASGQYKPVICHDKKLLEKINESSRKIKVGDKRLDMSQYNSYMNVWRPAQPSLVKYSDPVTGKSISIGDFDVSFIMKYEYYFGHLNDLPGTFALDSISAAKANIFFLEEDLYDFEKYFPHYSELSDVPTLQAMNIFCLSQFNFESIPSRMF